MMISNNNNHNNNVPLSTVHAWLLGVSGCCCSYFVGFWQDKFQLQNFLAILLRSPMRLPAQLAAKVPPGSSYQAICKRPKTGCCSLNCLLEIATHICGKVWT